MIARSGRGVKPAAERRGLPRSARAIRGGGRSGRRSARGFHGRGGPWNSTPIPSTEQPGPAARHDARALDWLAAAVWATSLALALGLDAPRADFPTFLAGAALAIAAWLHLLGRAAEDRLSPWLVRAALVAGLGARALALLRPPGFSSDVFRYVYEGRVVWYAGPAFPFVHPPSAGPSHGLPASLFDASWAAINHPEIPTIYPPFAQLVFAIAGGLGELLGGHHLLLLKGLLVLAELAALAILARALERRGRPRAEAVLLGLCPVLIVEVAREGHADALALLGLAVGAAAFATGRTAAGWAGWTLAALGKLNGLVALPVSLRATRRGLWAALPGLLLLGLPFLLTGAAAGQGLGAYASRWRAGDGSFGLLLAAAEVALGGDWRRLGPITLTRHGLARGLTAVAYLAALAGLLRRPLPVTGVPERVAWALLLLLLLSPTLHPWYALWLLPLVPLAGTARLPTLTLIALVWLNHHPSWLEATTGAWRDEPGLRALVHVPVWLAVIGAGRPLRRRPPRSPTVEPSVGGC